MKSFAYPQWTNGETDYPKTIHLSRPRQLPKGSQQASLLEIREKPPDDLRSRSAFRCEVNDFKSDRRASNSFEFV